ncbi:hypothetical protein BBP40_002906 [Aspergillus hancockii]|nr:hypothetical protein BBP40_002906 [Aspergillus hancockii]
MQPAGQESHTFNYKYLMSGSLPHIQRVYRRSSDPPNPLLSRTWTDFQRMQMASAQSEESSRPETDYGRWLRKQDEHYKPGDRPVDGPDMHGLDDPIENGKGKDRFSDGGDISVSESQE